MKTLNSISKTGNKFHLLPKLTLFISILLCLSLPKTSFGQTPSCNFGINNTSVCDAAITVEFFDAGGICNTITGVTVFANGFYNAGCASCGPLTDVKVTVDKISGVTVTGSNSVDINNQGPVNPTTTCSNQIYIDWTPSGVIIRN